jgi:hypothetical protein
MQCLTSQATITLMHGSYFEYFISHDVNDLSGVCS